jgi:hypothetical protein
MDEGGPLFPWSLVICVFCEINIGFGGNCDVILAPLLSQLKGLMLHHTISNRKTHASIATRVGGAPAREVRRAG